MRTNNMGNRKARGKTENGGNGGTAGRTPALKNSPAAGKTSTSEASFNALAAERPKAAPLGFKKEYMSGNICKATFRLPKDAAPGARKVTIVGDFNGWDKGSNPMKKLKSGDFTITFELEAWREYRFRYLIDGELWENDWHADKYVKSPYGVEDSVVCV